jgi:endoglucanase
MPNTQTTDVSNDVFQLSPLLAELLDAKSPTGHEFAAQAVVDKYVKPHAATYTKDALGNRIATINPQGNPTVLFTGHTDEVSLLISHVDEKGFLYFDFLGEHDLVIPSGRRVLILTKNGPVLGVTGKRAVHLASEDDAKKVPERQDIWIDIGASSREEALQVVHIGAPAVYDVGFKPLRGSIGVARAFDNRSGAYIVIESLLRLAKEPALNARVVAAATTQEEIGVPRCFEWHRC